MPCVCSEEKWLQSDDDGSGAGGERTQTCYLWPEWENAAARQTILDACGYCYFAKRKVCICYPDFTCLNVNSIVAWPWWRLFVLRRPGKSDTFWRCVLCRCGRRYVPELEIIWAFHLNAYLSLTDDIWSLFVVVIVLAAHCLRVWNEHPSCACTQECLVHARRRYPQNLNNWLTLSFSN